MQLEKIPMIKVIRNIPIDGLDVQLKEEVCRNCGTSLGNGIKHYYLGLKTAKDIADAIFKAEER